MKRDVRMKSQLQSSTIDGEWILQALDKKDGFQLDRFCGSDNSMATREAHIIMRI